MQIEHLKVGARTVESAKWNREYVYKLSRENDFPQEVVWEYLEDKGRYPTQADNIPYFDFKRTYVYLENKLCQEVIQKDTDGGYIYSIYPKTSKTAVNAKSFFKFTLPAYTSVKIEGLIQGYEPSQYTVDSCYVAVLNEEPDTSSASWGADQDKAEMVLYKEKNKYGYHNYWDSSFWNTYTGTVTNNTDNEKTYYLLLGMAQLNTYNSAGYEQGLGVKYLKFTKI